MPSSQVHQVYPRYTSEKALEKRLGEIFPESRASGFKIKVSCNVSSVSRYRYNDKSVLDDKRCHFLHGSSGFDSSKSNL